MINLLTAKLIVQGLATYIPRLNLFMPTSSGGTSSARYCYSVWLRHLVMASKNGLETNPNIVAELGPGDSLGIGLAALLSGANRYYAFDIVKFAELEKNLQIFDQLVELFKRREPIPDRSEFPECKPYLESYEFPVHILTEDRLAESLHPERVSLIKNALVNNQLDKKNKIQISYYAPWYSPDLIEKETVDMIYSQAVLEHVDDLDTTYKALNKWLKPGGFMSHQIDFRCHDTSLVWNGHWTYSDFTWKLIKGRKPYLINRQPHSAHIELLKKSKFKLISDLKLLDHSGIKRKQLDHQFKNISEDDLHTRGAFIQTVKGK